MEFRKMVMITLYVRQQERHWCIEQSFGLCGRGRGWYNLGERHWNMYNIIYETSRQSRCDARYWMLGAGALGRPSGMVWGGRREKGSGWGTHVYLWRIHFHIWQNQYNIVKLKNKKKFKKRKKRLLYQNMIILNRSNLCALVAQSHPTLCDPMDSSLPGSSVHGILQARILEWVDIFFSRGSSQPRDRTQVSCIAGRFFIIWATWKAPKYL